MDHKYTVGVRDFINRYVSGDDKIFELLPEFNYISYVAKKVKDNGCYCGLGGEIGRIVEIYNEFVPTISAELAEKTREVFNVPSICFAIETSTEFDRKCF